MRQLFKRLLKIACYGALPFLVACEALENEYDFNAKHEKKLSSQLMTLMDAKNMAHDASILIRIFKDKSILEVWKEKRNGRFALLKSYDICRWSGELGPKIAEGDRQAPEGFYKVTPALLNPNSDYHLAFNLGFPNAYDRAHKRTGSFLMIHGACSSSGCYAMTDEQMEELYALARTAFAGGQKAFQVHAFPFEMSLKNMAPYHDSEHLAFWAMLKEGYDHFEITRLPPRIEVCGKRYIFDPIPLHPDAVFKANAVCPSYEIDINLANQLYYNYLREVKALKQ